MTRQESIEALARVKDWFDLSEPARMISGVAVSTREEIKGSALDLRGLVETEEEIPLLLGHDVMRPLGIVRRIYRDAKIHVVAEVANVDHRGCWVGPTWNEILSGARSCFSIHFEALTVLSDSDVRQWRMTEVSVTPRGADPGAVITKAWTKARVVYLDDRPTTKTLFERETR